MTIRGSDKAPTLEQSAQQLRVPVSALDSEFGVVLIDHRRKIYSVRVDAAQLPQSTGAESVSGPFSDPRIAPFGLPE